MLKGQLQLAQLAVDSSSLRFAGIAARAWQHVRQRWGSTLSSSEAGEEGRQHPVVDASDGRRGPYRQQVLGVAPAEAMGALHTVYGRQLEVELVQVPEVVAAEGLHLLATEQAARLT